MRAAVFTAEGGPEVIRVVERPVPVPAHGELLVRVHASAMNRADVLQRQGRYPPPAGAPPDVAGLEFAGHIEALGPGTQRWRIGDRVFGLVSGGAHADYLTVHGTTVAAIPSVLDWTAAGATPEAFITAHDAMEQASVREGDTVLVHAVASGVGLAAIQLVRARRATALGTSRSADKLTRARTLGMADGLDTSEGTGGLAEWIASRTNERGVDVALDLVGGPYLPATIRVMAARGRIMLIGSLAGSDATISLTTVLRKRLTIRGTVLRSRAFDERAHDARAFERDVVPLLTDRSVTPVVDTVLPLREIGEAHRIVDANRTFGKVVIRMTDTDA